jgi:CelD/BcsL family acetyltransferase involved in cellulose biosynthesis
LWADCPWATVYQAAPFVTTWFDAYHEVQDPLLIIAREAGQLSGIFFLARSRLDGHVHHAGTWHAEYQGWLARPGRSRDFLRAAARLWPRVNVKQFRLHFAAPRLPLDWIPDVGAGTWAQVAWHRRGLMAVDAASPAREALRKKSNKSKISRLSQHGPLRLEQLRSSASLLEVFQEIIDFCDLRQGAINASTPFRSDPRKRDFYLALLDQESLLHATVLRAGESVVAAHLGAIDREHVSLGVIAHSPFLAAHSPGKFLIYYLAALLDAQGYRQFDLTPGGEYKDRFATSEDLVPSVSFQFSQWTRAKATGRGWAAKTVRKLGADVMLERAATGVVARALKTVGQRPVHAARIGLRRVRRSLGYSGEFRFYRMPVAEIPASGARTLRINSIADLLLCDERRKRAFLSAALARFERGQVSFTQATNDLLLHDSWLIPRTTRAGTEFGHSVELSVPSTVLWADETHASARGRGLHQASLRERLWYVAENKLSEQAVIGVRADNAISRHNIEKAAFAYFGSVWIERRAWSVRWWITGDGLRPVEGPVQPTVDESAQGS